MASEDDHSTSRPLGQLERALAAMTIGVSQSSARRERTLADGRLGEYEQQIHITLSGYAASGYAYADQPVSFEFPFVWSPAQRRSPFGTPHFTHGFELLTPTATLIIFGAHVTGWTTAPQGFLVGAMVRIHVAAPDSSAPTPYDAIAHLSFQGYAAYSESSEFFGGGDPIDPQTDTGGGAPINVVLPVIS